MDTDSKGVQDACVAPSQKFLVLSFRLKSKAFMLTFNSRDLKDDARIWHKCVVALEIQCMHAQMHQFPVIQSLFCRHRFRTFLFSPTGS